jgi:hypothetical protein
MSTLGFEVDWYDSCSQSVQRMFLKFFIDDNTLELVGVLTRCDFAHEFC